jgi:hypothetical protein
VQPAVEKSAEVVGPLVRVAYRARHTLSGVRSMAKPNYQYEKRQRELEKQKKKAAKANKKQSANEGQAAENDTTPGSTPPQDGG